MEENLESLVREHDRAIARIEQWIESRDELVGRYIPDIEELKLRDRETQVTQRLTYAVGGFAGTLIITLIIFIGTRG